MVILASGAILAVILMLANFSIDLKTHDASQADKGRQIGQPTQDMQTDPMTSHHEGTAADSSVFYGLVGKKAPDFTLESYGGKTVTLSKLKGKNVILFFNEGLMCYPACWNQIASFGKDTDLVQKAVILNITVDSGNAWREATDKMPALAAATVLFDSTRQASQKYGVLTLPSSMHKGQFPGHSYVIIDKEGVVKFVRDDVSMAVRNSELAQELSKL